MQNRLDSRKYLFCLKVINKNGSKPSFKKALLRNFGRAFFTVFGAIGLLTSTPKQKMARTRVVSTI